MDRLASAPWQALREAATIVLEACWCGINGHQGNKELSGEAGRALHWPRDGIVTGAAETEFMVPDWYGLTCTNLMSILCIMMYQSPQGKPPQCQALQLLLSYCIHTCVWVCLPGILHRHPYRF